MFYFSGGKVKPMCLDNENLAQIREDIDYW